MRWASARCACATTAISRAWRSRPRRWSARSTPRWRNAIARAIKPLGFRWVSLDLEGYRMGSLERGPLRPQLGLTHPGGLGLRRRTSPGHPIGRSAGTRTEGTCRPLCSSSSARGIPRAMGRGQGGACRDAIRERLARAGIQHRGRARASLRPFLVGPVLGAGMAREIVRHFPHLGERFQGMARGAGTSVDALMDLFVRGASGELPDEPVAAEARLGARAGAHAVVARSLQADACWIARRSRPEVGFASVELTLPWTATAVAGVNVAGCRRRHRADRRRTRGTVAVVPAARAGVSAAIRRRGRVPRLVPEAPRLGRGDPRARRRERCARGGLDRGRRAPRAGAGAATASSPRGAGILAADAASPTRSALRAGLGEDASPEALLAAPRERASSSVAADRSLRARTAPGEADRAPRPPRERTVLRARRLDSQGAGPGSARRSPG